MREGIRHIQLYLGLFFDICQFTGSLCRILPRGAHQVTGDGTGIITGFYQVISHVPIGMGKVFRFPGILKTVDREIAKFIQVSLFPAESARANDMESLTGINTKS